jgi:hypothetical protein
MQEAKDQNLEKILEEHTGKVYELYQNKSNSFQKTFRLLFSFALLFLFIILIPYITIRIINNRVELRQEKLKSEIGQKQDVMDIYKDVQNAIDKVHDDLMSRPQILHEIINSAHRGNVPTPLMPQRNFTAQQPIQTPLQQNDFIPVGTSINEWVQQEVQRQFKEYDMMLRRDVVKPLQSLNNDSLVLIDMKSIEAGLDTLKADFVAELSQDPRFWESYSRKEGFYSTLDEKVQHFWDIHIDVPRRQIQQQFELLKHEKNELDVRLNKMKEQEKQVGARLEQIEFPFGKLPVGLTESIAIFPIILAIGFLVVASQLREAIQLRKSFHQLYQRKDLTKTVLDDQQIALIAPLWIDPESTNKQKLFRFAILSIPFLIFIISCVLIFYNWSIPGFFAYAAQLNWWLYGGMYLLSLMIFVYGFRQILNELRGYSSN